MDVDEAYLTYNEDDDELEFDAGGVDLLLFAAAGAAFFPLLRGLHAVLAHSVVPPTSALASLGFAGGALIAARIRRRNPDAPWPAFAFLGLAVGLLLFTILFRLWPDRLDGVQGPAWVAVAVWSLCLAVVLFWIGSALSWSLCIASRNAAGPLARALFGLSLGLGIGAALLSLLGGPGAMLVLAMVCSLCCAWMAFNNGPRWIVWSGLGLASALLVTGAVDLFHPYLERGTGRAHWNSAARVQLEPSADGDRLLIDRRLRFQTGPGWDAPPVSKLPALLLDPTDVLVLGAAGDRQARWMLRNGATRVLTQPESALVPMALGKPTVELSWTALRGIAALGQQRFDLIWLPQRVDLRAARSGELLFHADRLLTREGIAAALEHLSDEGLLVIEAWPGDEGLLLGLLALVRTTFGDLDARRHVFAVQGDELALILVRRSPFEGGRAVGGIDALISACTSRGLTIHHAHLLQGRDRLTRCAIKYVGGPQLDRSPSRDRPFFFAFTGALGGAANDPQRLILFCAIVAAALFGLSLVACAWTLLIPSSRSRAAQRVHAFRSGLGAAAAALAIGPSLFVLGRMLAPLVGRDGLALAGCATAAALGLSIGAALSRALPRDAAGRWIKVVMALELVYLMLAVYLGPRVLLSPPANSLTAAALAAALLIPAAAGFGTLLGAGLTAGASGRLGPAGLVVCCALALPAGVLLSLLLPLYLGLIKTALCGAALGLLAAFVLPEELDPEG
ncbi:MAG: hypothetical protein P9M14_08920 [Candidatus Alcyoniella australis]|nr:hypothetical protein [Candidatus Alcyoniella australis]